MLRQFEKDKIAYLAIRQFNEPQINIIEEAVVKVIANIDWQIFNLEGEDYRKICRRENCEIYEHNPISQEVERVILNGIITWAELRLKEAEK